MRWITFDEETYSALHAARPQENAFEFPARTALQYALESKDTVMAVLPAGHHHAAMATFRPKRVTLPDAVGGPAITRPRSSVPATGNVRGGGILGLRDEPVFLEQEEGTPEKRNWWRRFWDY
jgi:hypothetical protein